MLHAHFPLVFSCDISCSSRNYLGLVGKVVKDAINDDQRAIGPNLKLLVSILAVHLIAPIAILTRSSAQNFARLQDAAIWHLIQSDGAGMSGPMSAILRIINDSIAILLQSELVGRALDFSLAGGPGCFALIVVDNKIAIVLHLDTVWTVLAFFPGRPDLLAVVEISKDSVGLHLHLKPAIFRHHVATAVAC